MRKLIVNSLTTPGIERRGHPRLALELACHLHSPANKSWKASGRTVNISRSGVLLKLQAPVSAHLVPALGSPLRVDIELPTKRLLRCHGRLVRMVDSATDGPVLAMAIQRMEFRESPRKPVVVAGNARWKQVKELLM
ncbi:MAG: PilZ domain-containing protein [Bryobacteraceae bacterium]